MVHKTRDCLTHPDSEGRLLIPPGRGPRPENMSTPPTELKEQYDTHDSSQDSLRPPNTPTFSPLQIELRRTHAPALSRMHVLRMGLGTESRTMTNRLRCILRRLADMWNLLRCSSSMARM